MNEEILQQEQDVKPVWHQIKTFMRDFRIKQTELKAYLKVSDSHLTRMLDGKRPITKKNLDKINEFLKTDF